MAYKSMTTDEDLWKLAKRFSIPVNSICFKDKLNDNSPSAGGYIINLPDSSTHGTHWTALWLDDPFEAQYDRKRSSNASNKSRCAYFDSFGIAPPLAVEEFCRRYGCHKILMSSKQYQSIQSGHCGQYCIDFLAFMSKNKHVPMEKRYQIFVSQFDPLN